MEHMLEQQKLISNRESDGSTTSSEDSIEWESVKNDYNCSDNKWHRRICVRVNERRKFRQEK